MSNGNLVEQATVARTAQVNLHEESQIVLHDWFVRRQKNSGALQQFATRVSQAKSPQDVMTAWIDWSKHAMTSLSEDFGDQWSLTNKIMPNVQEATPVTAVLEVIAPVLDANGVKRGPKTKRATKAKQKSNAEHHNIEHRSPSATKDKSSPHHAVKLDKLVDERLFTKLSVAGIERVGQVRKLTDAELKAVKGVGAKAISDIRTAVS